MSVAFAAFDAADARDLIAEYPLAWVLSSDPREQSLLPLLGEYDSGGRLTHLLGHMGRSNPLFRRLSDDPAATILINGPHGYVSPQHAGRRDWGPTWNYAQLAITAEVTFLPAESAYAVNRLTAALEGDRWSAQELGSRYEGMAAAIIAFRARVVSLTGRFKLGQDEPPEILTEILRTHPDAALVTWMRRFADRRA